MKKIAVALLIVLSACGDNAKPTGQTEQKSVESLNAFETVEALKTARLPIADVTTLTAESDENKLLGRPGQYVSKAVFFDSRYPKGSGEFEEPENTVETFASDADAKSRRDYVAKVTEGMPMLMQYQILRGRTLVRLNKALSPDQAKEYEMALASIIP